MISIRTTTLVTAIGLLFAVTAAPAGANCHKETVTLGNSEVDQYLESIPGSCGDQKLDGGGSGGDKSGSGGGGGSLPAGTESALESLGADGAATAAFVAATAPEVSPEVRRGAGKRGGGGGGGDGDGDGAAAKIGPPDASGSGLSAIAGMLSGDSDNSMGVLLPLILIATLIAVPAGIALRRRSSS